MPTSNHNALHDSSPAAASTLRAKRFSSLIKALFFFVSLVGFIVFVRIFDLQAILDPAWADSHLDFTSESGTWKSVPLYMGIVAILSPVGVPRQALSVLGGYVFGEVYGALFASIGLVFGCSAGFFYSRLLARESLRPRFGKRIQKLENFLVQKPFAMTVALRFFPMGNNALLNLAAGVTRIPPAPFISGSAIGYLPQTIIFALLGSGIRIDPVWRVLVSGLLFLLATGIGLVLYRKYRGEQTDLGSPQPIDASSAIRPDEESGT